VPLRQFRQQAVLRRVARGLKLKPPEVCCNEPAARKICKCRRVISKQIQQCKNKGKQQKPA
jgi:hypothetical protein